MVILVLSIVEQKYVGFQNIFLNKTVEVLEFKLYLQSDVLLRRNLCFPENIQKISYKYLDQIQIEMFTSSGSEAMLLCNSSRNQQR